MSDSFPSWYHGCMAAEEATAICMKVGQNGAFLVRQSQGAKGSYTLSMFFDGQVYHHRVRATSGKNVILESSKREFQSLEKLVEYHMSPREEFFYPLTVAIYPSLVKQLYADNQSWHTNIPATTPLYDVKTSLNSGKFHTPIPKPNVSPNPACLTQSYYEEVIPLKSPKQIPHKVPTTVSGAIPQRPPTILPMPSASTTSPHTPDDESWPAPPPPIIQKPSPPVKPKPKPKPKPLQRSRSSDYDMKKRPAFRKSSQPSASPEAGFTTFGKSDEDAKSESVSRTRTARPRSCVIPASNGIELVCDFPDGDDGGQPLRRRRTLSLDEFQSSGRNQSQIDQSVKDRKYETIKLPTHNSSKSLSQNPSKSGTNKKSKFKSFAHFLNRITTKSQPSSQNHDNRKSVQNEKEEEKEKYIKDEETNNNQAVTEDYTPILCKTQFVTISDYSTTENAMNFTKGTEIAVKGVRVDGWWYCYNKVTQESGWIHMDYLKPKSDEKWFEAKPVETTRDYQVYDELDFGSEFDSEFDDDNYCKYLIPAEDTTNAGGNVNNFGQTDSEVSIGAF